MVLSIKTESPPLRVDSHGVVRVGQTRVTLDTVASAFKRGTTAEEIVRQYSTLELADVYTTIGYYLQRREEVDAYLAERARGAEQVRRENEARFDPIGVRERLLARRTDKNKP
jgi:uncharacterized protein (DUF433 family)